MIKSAFKVFPAILCALAAFKIFAFQAEAASIQAQSTIGGSLDDTIFDVAVTEDAIFWVGRTMSADFPVLNPAQSTFGGDPNGVGDIFVAKLDKSTQQILFSTFLGGSGSELGNGIVVDLNGNIRISGWTDSIDFPVTENAFQPQNAGKTDGIVAIFSPLGELVYSSYCGGLENDEFASIGITDNQFLFDGSFAVVGFSNSANYPATAGLDGTCSSCVNGGTDAVVTMFNADGSLKWSQFLGGRTDTARDVALDVKVLGSVIYVTGWTEDADFPNRPTDIFKGGKDVFVTTFDSSDGDQRFSTTRGGSGDDIAQSIDVGNGSFIFITGSTGSSDFPIAGNESTFQGGATDAFLMRINAEGGTVVPFSTFIGGSGDDQGRSVIFESFSFIHVGGVTSSLDLLVQNAIQESFGGGGTDNFVSSINVNTGTFDVLSYLGGSGDDGITNGALFNPASLDEKKDTIYVGGSGSLDVFGVPANSGEAGEVIVVSPQPKKKFDLEVKDLTVDDTDPTATSVVTMTFKVRNNGPDESDGLIIHVEFPPSKFDGIEGDGTTIVTAMEGNNVVIFDATAFPKSIVLENLSYSLLQFDLRFGVVVHFGFDDNRRPQFSTYLSS